MRPCHEGRHHERRGLRRRDRRAGRAFRFKRIGGTSAGAIGAAVAAAAEYARSRDGRPGMTARLQPLIEDLTTPGYFAGLLQPFPSGRPVLKAMLALLRQQRRPAVRVMAALWHVVLARWWWPLLSAAGAAVVIWALLRDAALSTPWTAVLIALIVLLGVLLGLGLPVALLVRATWKGLGAHENRLGLCSGISTGKKPALTDWLHTTIQRTAGLPETKPLTFRRLGKAGIELAMITTELASARPLRLPLAKADAETYWYDPHELQALFPSSVCDYVNRIAGPVDEQGLRPLPTERLPVVVALRMSLSVPVLLACVPLYAAPGDSRPSRDRRSWFTDGGVTSNFPIHFFDAWLPRRPTFGLDLRPVPSQCVERFHLPGLDDPPEPRWEDVDGPAGLLRQIVDAAQNWRDTAQAELPGFRDRICQVRLYPGEGGLHINMPAASVQELIKAGRGAGRAFVAAFDERRMLGHQARRYVVLTQQLQEGLDAARQPYGKLEPRLYDGLPAGPAYGARFRRLTRKRRDGCSRPRTRRRNPEPARCASAGSADRPQDLAAAFPQHLRRRSAAPASDGAAHVARTSRSDAGLQARPRCEAGRSPRVGRARGARRRDGVGGRPRAPSVRRGRGRRLAGHVAEAVRARRGRQGPERARRLAGHHGSPRMPAHPAPGLAGRPARRRARGRRRRPGPRRRSAHRRARPPPVARVRGARAARPGAPSHARGRPGPELRGDRRRPRHAGRLDRADAGSRAHAAARGGRAPRRPRRRGTAMRSAVTAFTVTEVPLELEPVTADPFIDDCNAPLSYGPVIEHVIPSPAWSAGVPVASP